MLRIDRAKDGARTETNLAQLERHLFATADTLRRPLMAASLRPGQVIDGGVFRVQVGPSHTRSSRRQRRPRPPTPRVSPEGSQFLGGGGDVHIVRGTAGHALSACDVHQAGTASGRPPGLTSAGTLVGKIGRHDARLPGTFSPLRVPIGDCEVPECDGFHAQRTEDTALADWPVAALGTGPTRRASG